MKQEAEATHAKIKIESIFPITMCNMICNYEFMMNEGYDTMIYEHCRSRYRFLSLPPLVERASLDHPYKNTTLQKDHLFQTKISMKKGFQDEKWVPVVA